MNILATGNLSGVEVDARATDGHTPNECFLNCRDTHCAVAREPSSVERQSWIGLIKSARRQNELPYQVANENERTGVKIQEILNKDES